MLQSPSSIDNKKVEVTLKNCKRSKCHCCRGGGDGSGSSSTSGSSGDSSFNKNWLMNTSCCLPTSLTIKAFITPVKITKKMKIRNAPNDHKTQVN
ncbi:unnamed protein product [Trichobilharzia regenti]|nr:unnamed protein product [Trichobilharzia regenti]